MNNRRFAPLNQLRCVCGHVGVIPEELRHFSVEILTLTDYTQIEKASGFKVLFPEIPANKLVWLCPNCWFLVRKQSKRIAKRLGGMWHFSLTQLTSKTREKI